ncbi:hypothetical protein LIER_15561 [Lithospermum erythrorhizon]|uniref:Zinc-ribbon domain-containing protein n=1 Tax=Lithospermum erythrorhizon TaxID=34254 RepID=A0AAV3Q5B4_LITER
MEETSKVRLVRCPKCGNILPEQPNLSVFQCGGCLAVLQANTKEIADDGLSETSGEGERREVDEKGENNVDPKSVIRDEVKNDDMYGREEEGIESEKSISNGHSAVRTEESGKMAHSVMTRQGEEMIGTRFNDHRRNAFHDNEDYRLNLRNSVDDPSQRNPGDAYLSEVEQKFANYSFEDEIEGIRLPATSRRTKSVIDDRSMERNGSVSSWRNGANVVQPRRSVKPLYYNEGPSNYAKSSYDGYGEQMRYPKVRDGLARIAHLENDRAELLKKLDELKEQISRSGEVAERPGERISDGRRPPTPSDPYARYDAYNPDGFQFYSETQALHSDKYFPVPPNLNRGYDRAPSIQRRNLSSNDSCPPSYFPNSLAGDAYYPQMSRRPLHQSSHPYSQRAYMDHFPDGRMAFNQDIFMSHPHETAFHQLSCSCSHCMNKNWYGHAEIPTPETSILRSKNDPANVTPYLHINSTAMGPKGYSSEGSHPHGQQQFSRPPHLMAYENGDFHNQRTRQVIVAKEGARVYRPMAGGPPFITCLHCFELLKIPAKILRETNQGQVKCGACSSIFELECGPKGIALSVSGDNKHAVEDISYFSDDMPNGILQNDWLKHNSKIPFSSGDGHSDSVLKQSLEEQRSSFCESEKKQSHQISCSSLSENEESPDNVIVRENISHPAKLPLEDDVLPSPEDSPLQSDDLTNLYGNISEAERMGNENSMVEQITSIRGSMKEEPIASEMDISVNEYTNSGTTQVSTEVSKEGSKSRINKFAGLLKRSFKEFARSGHEIENEKSSIIINGHVIPDRLLKKAEKVAGPIQHGEYWYDYTAGFWGGMGHPCAGIIPPKIEEFKFPMPENCSNGNTKVFVNGRELHQKDLELLSSRGLSITRHKYYLIEISGEVLDEQTGEELESLGKLAPTIERVGQGFGMKNPKPIAH